MLDFQGGWAIAEVWIVDSAGRAGAPTRASEASPLWERPLPSSTLAVPLDLRAGDRVLARLRLEDKSGVNTGWLRYEVRTADAYAERRRLNDALNGVYAGIVVAVVAYTFFLFLATRYWTYLLYVAYASAFGLTWITSSGFGFELLWPFAPRLTFHIAFIAPALSAFWGVWFARNFLSASEHAPRIDRALVGTQVAAVVALGLFWARAYDAAEALLGALSLVIVCLASALTVAGLRARFPPARIFLFAMGPLLFFVALYVLGYFGFLPWSSVVERGPQFASALEKVLLAFGVANRINFLKGEKAAAEQALRESLQGEVAARTQELQEAYSQLETTNRALMEANSQLSELSTTDALTSLPNRRHFDQILQVEWARCHRHEAPLSLLLADIDHFKEYNDLYGHPEGDECLALVAGVLAQQCRRAGDVVARYGGEEFAVLLPATSAEEALRMADALRRAVEGLAVPHEGSPTSELVTLSVGSATVFPEAGSAPLDLVASADRALYAAKRRGRNRVCAA